MLTVANVGTAATNGTVTVTDTLPAGLTGTGMSGSGWNVNPGTLTATRTDAIAAGGAYPPLSVTVNVAANAAASLNNIATVSGGGETNTTNNTATDVTTIAALAPADSWRLQWFGTASNTGAAADTAIPAGDSLPNLLKYALNLTPPHSPATISNVVIADTAAGVLRLTVTKNPAATDVTYTVEGTSNLADPNSWSTTSIVIDQDTSTILQAHDNSPTTNSPHFLRLKVSRP